MIKIQMIFPLLLSLTISGTSLAQGQPPLSVKIEKLSQHLRGRPLSIVERLSLAVTSSEGVNEAEYLNSKADEYLETNLFEDAFVFWQAERFHMKTFVYNSSVPGEISENSEEAAKKRDSFHGFSKDVFSQNQSWDELLTGKSYRLIPQTAVSDQRLSDFDFYSLVKPELPREGEMLAKRPQDYGVQMTETKIDFAREDVRIAGLLTTPRFFSRFTTTDVNKNRRRASQVYRLFLCDPMFPVIPEEADRKSKYVNYIFRIHEEMGEEEVIANLENAHGQQKECVGCHSKLDPMGRTFQNHAFVLHPSPTAGNLVIRRATKDLDEPVNGIGKLTSLLVQQPEYASCQVRTFWRQFIGKNVSLSEEKEVHLIKEFDRVGRRTKDFIKVIVSQPEFYSEPIVEEELRFDHVKPLLKRCDTCHNTPNFPKFGEIFAQEMTEENRLQWLVKVKARVDLPAGTPGKMPKDYAVWTAADLEMLKRWLNEGAKDNEGQAWLPEN